MDYKALMYLVYLAVSVGLTVWVATTLSRNGQIFLEDVFDDTRLARAVNQLLTMGFYLLNLGYAAVAMRSGKAVRDTGELLEVLSGKVGLVLLVLGVLHFGNVLALGRYRRSRMRQAATAPPLPPSGRLPMAPPPPMPPQMQPQAPVAPQMPVPPRMPPPARA